MSIGFNDVALLSVILAAAAATASLATGYRAFLAHRKETQIRESFFLTTEVAYLLKTHPELNTVITRNDIKPGVVDAFNLLVKQLDFTFNTENSRALAQDYDLDDNDLTLEQAFDDT